MACPEDRASKVTKVLRFGSIISRGVIPSPLTKKSSRIFSRGSAFNLLVFACLSFISPIALGIPCLGHEVDRLLQDKTPIESRVALKSYLYLLSFSPSPRLFERIKQPHSFTRLPAFARCKSRYG